MLRSSIVFASGFVAVLLTGWLVFPNALYQKSAQPLEFSHRTHTEKAAMKCEDCHSFRPDGTFTGIPQVDKCAGCHASPVGTSAAEKILVERYVTPNREIPWKVYSRQPDNAWFPHAYHVNLAKLACTKCHGEHAQTTKLRDYEVNRLSGYSRDFWKPSVRRTSSATGLKMTECEHCHGEKGVATGCLDCHK
jgi:menaquinone reductase, multiheme cytochrome c subunit